MSDRRTVVELGTVSLLLDLIERRFDLRIQPGSTEHLREVYDHYYRKREIILHEYGEAGALARDDYAKAFMVSEAARMLILREIVPRPRKKKIKKDTK